MLACVVDAGNSGGVGVTGADFASGAVCVEAGGGSLIAACFLEHDQVEIDKITASVTEQAGNRCVIERGPFPAGPLGYDPVSGRDTDGFRKTNPERGPQPRFAFEVDCTTVKLDHTKSHSQSNAGPLCFRREI